jgi:hypothetical protein
MIWVTTVGMGLVPVVVGGAGDGGADSAIAAWGEIARIVRIVRANGRKSFRDIFIG